MKLPFQVTRAELSAGYSRIDNADFFISHTAQSVLEENGFFRKGKEEITPKVVNPLGLEFVLSKCQDKAGSQVRLLIKTSDYERKDVKYEGNLPFTD